LNVFRRGGFKVGSIGGIPIRLDSSWFWIALVYSYTLYVGFSRSGASDGESIALALLSSALFFGSVFVHELAHAGAARALGIEVRGITLVFWGGFTETTHHERGPVGDILVSGAGPVSSLLLGGVFWASSIALAGSTPELSSMVGYLGWLNAVLAGLNALPGFPLDGGHVFRAIVWRVTGSRERATRAAAIMGVVIGGGLIAFAVYAIARGEIGFAVWGFLIGSMMISAARNSREGEAVREALSEGTVRDAMQPPPPAVPADLSLSETLDRYLRGHEEEVYPVVENGRVAGMISFETARRVGGLDPLRPARDGMVPLREVAVVRPDTGLAEALRAVGPGRAALVLDGDDALVGSLRPIDVESWLRARRAGATSARVSEEAPPRPDARTADG
jgi:Zn-dependent protease